MNGRSWSCSLACQFMGLLVRLLLTLGHRPWLRLVRGEISATLISVNTYWACDLISFLPDPLFREWRRYFDQICAEVLNLSAPIRYFRHWWVRRVVFRNADVRHRWWCLLHLGMIASCGLLPRFSIRLGWMSAGEAARTPTWKARVAQLTRQCRTFAEVDRLRQSANGRPRSRAPNPWAVAAPYARIPRPAPRAATRTGRPAAPDPAKAGVDQRARRGEGGCTATTRATLEAASSRPARRPAAAGRTPRPHGAVDQQRPAPGRGLRGDPFQPGG